MAYGPGRAELALALHALGAETTSGVSAAIDLADGSAYTAGCGQRSLAYLDLDVTAASGMGAVASTGTTPPTITLSGVPSRGVALLVQCTGAGALGVWTGRYSIDAGVTWTLFTSAASVPLAGTGVTMAIAPGSAATDNVWTATTPLLAVTIETSRDLASWRASPTGAFDGVAIAGWQRRAFLDLDRYVRARWTLTGTGASFTFSVNGSALLVYAGLANASSLALRAAALVDLSAEEKADALVAASDQTDQKIGKRFQLPLVSWGMGVAKHTASIAALTMMEARGYAPEPGQRDTFKDGYDRSIDFFEDVFASGDPSIVDQDPADDFNTGIPDPVPRRWTDRGWTR